MTDKKRFAWLNRRAICGACGCEAEVTSDLRRLRSFQERRDQPTDLYYCGCQNQDDVDDDWGAWG